MSTHSTSARPIRAVLLLGSFPPQTQGVPNYCGDLATALSERVEVNAIGFAKMYPDFLFPGVKQAMDDTRESIATDTLRLRNVLTYYNPLRWIWTALRTPADVVHVQWWSLPLLPVAFTFACVARLRRKPLVVTIHNVLPHERRSLFVFATKLVCAFAQRIIVHGAKNVEDAARIYGFDPERVHDVPIGITPRPAPPYSQAEARGQFNIDESAKVVLFFGIIRDYKGLDILIEAFSQLAANDDTLRLVIAGKPWTDWSPYEALIEQHGLANRIHLFIEYIPENRIGPLFAAADVVALPYRHFNAQSAVAMQSVEHKRPTIVSRVGALPECVGHDEKWIAEPSDIESLTDRLQGFFSDPAQNTRDFATIAEAVCAERAWSNVAERHLDIYAEALDSK